jgi:uncharacterized OB-fold protein
MRLLHFLCRFANPKRPPLKRCHNCGAGNEPDRSACISCGESI